MKRSPLILFVVFFTLSFSQQQNNRGADSLKLNQIQVIATHNSYHKKTDGAIFRFLSAIYALRILPADFDPKGIDYTKGSLTEQLNDYHVHGLELDIWNDPEGGRFYYRMGKPYVFQHPASGIEELKQPGFKLLHIPDFDYNSTNLTFKSALVEIKKWSDAHPDHLPVFINVETEVATPGDQVSMLKRLTHAAPFDSLAAENLDTEVKSVFGEKPEGVITPDQVRGNYPTLEQAVLAGNWPTLASARGKVIFIMDHGGNSGEVYKRGHPSFKGRVLFTYANPGTPEAAFVILNDPKPDFAQIQKRVKEGYIVRTRSDGETVEARTGDYSLMNAAFASGAQIISTDYYKPDPRAGKKNWSNYHVQFGEGRMVRIDSLSAPDQLNAGVIKE